MLLFIQMIDDIKTEDDAIELVKYIRHNKHIND